MILAYGRKHDVVTMLLSKAMDLYSSINQKFRSAQPNIRYLVQVINLCVVLVHHAHQYDVSH